ncbi:MAG: hypothetical protein DRH90_22885 [Deltaproteobacteria bacterium]|nr:MAG: hypothetical protein DRH90_22885 [Deltaproteobacteria bacterium]
MTADQWIDIGTLSQTPATKNRPSAHYRAFDTTVSLYKHEYRAIVVHSSAHDKRRQKRILRLLDKKNKQLRKLIKQATNSDFFALPMLSRSLKTFKSKLMEVITRSAPRSLRFPNSVVGDPQKTVPELQ